MIYRSVLTEWKKPLVSMLCERWDTEASSAMELTILDVVTNHRPPNVPNSLIKLEVQFLEDVVTTYKARIDYEYDPLYQMELKSYEFAEMPERWLTFQLTKEKQEALKRRLLSDIEVPTEIAAQIQTIDDCFPKQAAAIRGYMHQDSRPMSDFIDCFDGSSHLSLHRIVYGDEISFQREDAEEYEWSPVEFDPLGVAKFRYVSDRLKHLSELMLDAVSTPIYQIPRESQWWPGHDLENLNDVFDWFDCTMTGGHTPELN